MKAFYEELRAIIARDAGGRGIISSLPAPDLDALEAEFAKAKRIMIITGFPMAVEGRVCCETDGPLGTADMARAFTETGRAVCVVTDEANMNEVRAALDHRAPSAMLRILKRGDAESARETLRAFEPTHIIALERPGKALDGHFHSMRGNIIDSMICDTDSLFTIAKARGAVAIGIGDGGNELGMGNFEDEVAETLENGREVAAHQGSDFALVSGVSNWWGWGVAAMLSFITGRDLLPSDEEETALLRAVIDAGGVDGITKLPEMSVDHLSLRANLDILDELRSALHRALESKEAK